MKWVVYCLVAHEQSIKQLRKLASNEGQSEPLIEGVTNHLLNIESKIGIVLFILGFLFLAVGMLANAAAYLFANT